MPLSFLTRLSFWLLFGSLVFSSVLESRIGWAEEPELNYNEHIRPILATNCFACHGMDSATREAGLRLDKREDAVDYGAIVPGASDESELIVRIRLAEDDEMRMPPTNLHKELTEEEMERLARWIDAGAEYQPHWSFIAPQRPEIPTTKTQSCDNPIDRFVLRKLEAMGQSFAPQADRRTLARRAALDVTGLPPEPAWVEAFLQDTQPGAYERYLDHLLAQPTWGEHRGRYWLDYARYADTHGIHFDNYREMWIYRDWVFQAFNENKPFDEFSIEQLAGDLLDEPTLEQRIATGLHRCNITTNEGGIIDEEYKVLYARDRTETTAAIWLGLTAGCAVCHDHKFDPLSAKEFYSLSAFFNNTTQAVKDGNVSDTPPIVEVPIPQDRERLSDLLEQISVCESNVAAIENRAEAEAKESQVNAAEIVSQLPQPSSLVLHAPLSEGVGDTSNLLVSSDSFNSQSFPNVDRSSLLIPATSSKPLKWASGITARSSLLVSKQTDLSIPDVGDIDFSDPYTVSAWVYPTRKNISGAIVAKMDQPPHFRGWDLWLSGERVTAHIIHKWPEIAIKVSTRNRIPIKQWSHVAMTNDGLGKADSVHLFINGVEQTNVIVEKNSLDQKTIRSDAPLTIGTRSGGDAVDGLQVADVRIYSVALSEPETDAIAKWTPAVYGGSLSAANRTPEQTAAMTNWFLAKQSNYGDYLDETNKLRDLRQEREAIRQRGTIAHVMHEKPEPAKAHVLLRGEYDQLGEEVAADVPAILPALENEPRNRLGLARWLFRDDHPLTARVTVNRFWQEVFGTGLVRTSADFGVMGELPSHPELLDYLAVEFLESGWDVKQLFRLMLTSEAYRQSARMSDWAIERDPENRWLSHGPRFRMDAEMIRDSALWASDLLEQQIGGPSVKPYQPVGVWEAVAMPGSNTRSYKIDNGEDLYRRSVYTFWKRAAPPASLEIMGAPSREICTIRRETSNTPLQALVVLNDPQFVEAARKLAELTLQKVEADDDVDRFQFIANRVLSRLFDDEELDILGSSITALRDHFAEHSEDADELIEVGESASDASLSSDELAAWTMLASQILNLDEALCK